MMVILLNASTLRGARSSLPACVARAVRDPCPRQRVRGFHVGGRRSSCVTILPAKISATPRRSSTRRGNCSPSATQKTTPESRAFREATSRPNTRTVEMNRENARERRASRSCPRVLRSRLGLSRDLRPSSKPGPPSFRRSRRHAGYGGGPDTTLDRSLRSKPRRNTASEKELESRLEEYALMLAGTDRPPRTTNARFRGRRRPIPHRHPKTTSVTA
jgi:hypothetical protein